jgi:prepilin-type N-terminal cleavage/methylation domain-containing protein
MSATACSNNRIRRQASGFTLLEVLVVLIIVGLVAASLFEGLARLNDVRGRLSPFLSTSEREGLLNGWFRTAVNDIVPDKENGKHVFKGTAASFSGLTLTPFAQDPGGPSAFTWDLAYDAAHDRTELRYTGYDQKPLTLRGWDGHKTGFTYLGPDLAWHDAWPPGLQKSKQLPLAIRLLAGDQGFVLVGAIRGEKDPPPDPVKLFVGQ